MRKTILFALMCLATLSTKAQEKKSATTPFFVEATLGAGTPCKKLHPIDANFNVGFQITKRFSVQTTLGTGYIIPKDGGVKDYNKYMNLGGGIGYVIHPANSKDKDEFAIRASYTASITSKDYSNNAFSAGLYWYPRHNTRSIEPVVGVGYNFMNFRKKGTPNYNGAFFSFGIRF